MRISKQSHTRRYYDPYAKATLRKKVFYSDPSPERMAEIRADIEKRREKNREIAARKKSELYLYKERISSAVEKSLKKRNATILSMNLRQLIA